MGGFGFSRGVEWIYNSTRFFHLLNNSITSIRKFLLSVCASVFFFNMRWHKVTLVKGCQASSVAEGNPGKTLQKSAGFGLWSDLAWTRWTLCQKWSYPRLHEIWLDYDYCFWEHYSWLTDPCGVTVTYDHNGHYLTFKMNLQQNKTAITQYWFKLKGLCSHCYFQWGFTN